MGPVGQHPSQSSVAWRERLEIHLAFPGCAVRRGGGNKVWITSLSSVRSAWSLVEESKLIGCDTRGPLPLFLNLQNTDSTSQFNPHRPGPIIAQNIPRT